MILCCYVVPPTWHNAGPNPSRNKPCKTLVNSLNSWQAYGSVCKDSPPEYPKHSTTFPNITHTNLHKHDLTLVALQLNKLRERVHELTADLNREKKDKEAVKSQAESLNREYDRLTEEYSKLQKQITIGAGGGSSNKDD